MPERESPRAPSQRSIGFNTRLQADGEVPLVRLLFGGREGALDKWSVDMIDSTLGLRLAGVG